MKIDTNTKKEKNHERETNRIRDMKGTERIVFQLGLGVELRCPVRRVTLPEHSHSPLLPRDQGSGLRALHDLQNLGTTTLNSLGVNPGVQERVCP